ncbi:MAG: hypothetical protein SOH70_03770 [Lentilactobacillus sunkii]|jgi:hypothetical protein|uniref:hypothetical protein n=1 Tax=Lentilactobacillus sunkii TaxID=481719 RepID=UPI002F359E5A
MAIYFQGKKVIPYFNGKKIGAAYYHGVKVYSSVLATGTVIWKPKYSGGAALGGAGFNVDTPNRDKTGVILAGNTINLDVDLKKIQTGFRFQSSTMFVGTGNDFLVQNLSTNGLPNLDKKLTIAQLQAGAVYYSHGNVTMSVKLIAQTLTFTSTGTVNYNETTYLDGYGNKLLLIQSVTAY